ncbi:hypothetical protein [Actinomadura litoris]|uniref:hypothetical protein n=1 Tax=Actinomadura litoris TaxID=2678616 RepID=UPI001FA81728|nr:hypothetical protein [Actinomadura litoris]
MIRVLSKGAVLGAAAVLPLGLVSSVHEAEAATTRPTAVQRNAEAGEGYAKRGKWHTFKSGHRSVGPALLSYAGKYKRPKGVRIIQVKARCWGSDSLMKIHLDYRRNGAWKAAKKASQPCNGRYRTVRITNAGHTWYGATFRNDRPKTVEFWIQYYK